MAQMIPRGLLDLINRDKRYVCLNFSQKKEYPIKILLVIELKESMELCSTSPSKIFQKLIPRNFRNIRGLRLAWNREK